MIGTNCIYKSDGSPPAGGPYPEHIMNIKKRNKTTPLYMIAEAAYQAVALNPEPAAMFILGIGRFSLAGCDTRKLSTGASESRRPHAVQVLITDDGVRDPYQ